MGHKPDPEVDHQTGEIKPKPASSPSTAGENPHKDYDRALEYAETCKPEQFEKVRARAREKFGRQSFECLSITKVLDERWATLSRPIGAKA